jgi:1,2-diacylglycerol 3-beta-glucosyltransferase
MTRLFGEDPFMAGVVSLVVLLSLSYTMAIFLMSRRKRPEGLPPPDSLFFVFVVPCLNEELVIERTLDSLSALPGENYAVLVVDDNSEDRTVEIVSNYDADNVWLLERKFPEAQKGKGESLNAAFRYLRDSDVLSHMDPADVVVAIFDADGRIEPNALFEVGSHFRNPQMGAVQIGVRMYNAHENILTRIQDFEFVTFTEVFQRGRQRMGSVGLGGNGQFARLSALESLGDAPWTDCLTEDLDLGVRLLCEGWTNGYCSTSHVSQQGVTKFRRLLKQRARWFQGHMQCWKRIPDVLRSKLPEKTVWDLVYHLSSPSLVLLMTFPLIIFILSLVSITFESADGIGQLLTAKGGLLLLGWYLLSFGLAPFYAFVYWLRTKEKSFLKALYYGHVYNLYSYMWFIVGWVAVFRILTGRRGWAKTKRTPEAQPS